MKYSPTRYNNVYIVSAGRFLPGEPIDNDQLDQYIALINQQSSRIKKRILNDNGIVTRHYGINTKGETQVSAAQMAANAINHCLQQTNIDLEDVSMLCTGTSGADVLMPGFANMLQGHMHAAPMETRSHHGICASGIAALKDAANHVDNGTHQYAVVATAEYPSRLFKKVRYEPMGYDIDFNAHFLRWMLSDGAGALCLANTPAGQTRLSLKLDWAYTKSFSGDYPTCMQMGLKKDNDSQSFMDYPSFSFAEADGALTLRQDIRLLPQLFEVGIHEYAELVKHRWLDPNSIDHFLCHYSSEKLGTVCNELMSKAGLAIPRERWYSNLAACGNTGAASIFIMLADFLAQKELKEGEKIFCFVPESGRFTVSYMQFTVVNGKHPAVSTETDTANPPHQAKPEQSPVVQQLLQALSSIWHEYRSNIWRTPLVKKILTNNLNTDDYINWMACWIPQVREGSKWMKLAANNLSPNYQQLKELILMHSGEEQNDFMILFEDYLASGGQTKTIEDLQRNPGGEALNSYMYRQAMKTDAFGLLGGIYIIEGTGQRIIPALLPLMRHQIDLPDQCFKFLNYHGENDVNHLQRWLTAVEMVLSTSNEKQIKHIHDEIISTARHAALLYHMQWECIS